MDQGKGVRRVADLKLEMPWGDHPGNVYVTDGPDELIEFELMGHRFKVAPTGDTGFDTGRELFWVECLTCKEVLHENTTGPRPRIRSHIEMEQLRRDVL